MMKKQAVADKAAKQAEAKKAEEQAKKIAAGKFNEFVLFLVYFVDHSLVLNSPTESANGSFGFYFLFQRKTQLSRK